MTHQEITDFFKQRGSKTDFKIVDSPLFTHRYIKGKVIVSQMLRVGDGSITSVQGFIDNQMNNYNQDIFIYAEQDFCDDMKIMRWCAIQKDILEVRRFKMNKIKKKLDDRNKQIT